MYCLDFHLSITIIFMVYKTIDIAPCSAILTFSLDYPFFFQINSCRTKYSRKKIYKLDEPNYSIHLP